MLRLWTVNGSPVARAEVLSRVTLLSYTSAPEGVFVNVVIGGLANGNIRSCAVTPPLGGLWPLVEVDTACLVLCRLWSSWDLSVVWEMRCPLDKPISVVRYESSCPGHVTVTCHLHEVM